jgi:hypothetical protein
MTTITSEEQRAARPGRRRSAWVRALVAVPLMSLLGLAAVAGTASAAPASAPSQHAAAPHAVLPVGAIEAGTGMQPDINYVGCYVGDDFWDMKISGTWYCYANNGSVNVYPNYYDVTAIYTHNNSGSIWYYDVYNVINHDPLNDWTNYHFDAPYDLHLTGFEITGR